MCKGGSANVCVHVCVCVCVCDLSGDRFHPIGKIKDFFN